MKRQYRILTAVIASASVLCACQKEEQVQPEPKIENCAIIHETEFGGVYIKSTIDDFNKLGFVYGDSVNVEFSNGFKLEDVPYYNGYYVDAGQPLLIAYPGYDYIKAAVNYGDDLWETAGLQQKNDQKLNLWMQSKLEEHDTASVYLNERGKYADIQAARDIHYYDERERYTTDEEFANFRSIHMGRIAENRLYRSASPCDNQHNRAPYVDRLIEQAGVNGIMNLSDSHLKIRGYMEKENFDSPYFLSLYQNDQVIPLALNMNYLSEEFAVTAAQGLKELAKLEPPYLIHCTEGKDRTGFICMLVEALAGADYQQIADDYMVTYDNYYGITADSEPDKYQTILEKNLDAMIRSIVGDESINITNTDLSVYAKNYLLKAGMSEEEITAFLNRICE
ncbi:MAG: tyrosine-protein phosphatase [Solobacterium sp.]|nr:tyrosine-protein phosphatase [Solobacterium sp.]